MTDELMVTPGAPTPLCLYADHRWEESETHVYLCNAGPDAITNVTVASDMILMYEFYVIPPDKRWAGASTDTVRWDAILPGRGVLLDTPSHKLWDLVSRHRLTFSDVAGRRWKAEVLDLALNASRLGQDPEAVWVPIAPEAA